MFLPYRTYKVLKLLLFTLILFLFNVLLINRSMNRLSEPKRENHNLSIYDGTYACHDSVSCGIKYEKSTYNPSTDPQSNEVFISALYTENYFRGSLLLGYTIKKYHPNHAMYLLYFPSQISASLICQLEAVGWIMKEVERIPVPWEAHLSDKFVDQFTKLHIWSLNEFNSIIYIDSDAIVLQKIDYLFEIVNSHTKFEFAAAPDVLDKQILTKFNAGFFVLKPDINVYKEIMRVHKVRDSYNIDYAEQNFLNEFYKFRHIQLPITYNFNLALLECYPHLWSILFPDIKVIHFTVKKPFLPNTSSEIFEEPFEIWNSLYGEMEKVMGLANIMIECENIHRNDKLQEI